MQRECEAPAVIAVRDGGRSSRCRFRGCWYRLRVLYERGLVRGLQRVVCCRAPHHALIRIPGRFHHSPAVTLGGMDKERIWHLYLRGADFLELCWQCPGLTPAELRRVVVEVAASVVHHIEPRNLIRCQVCGTPSCVRQGMRIHKNRWTCVECVTLEWLRIE